MNDTTNEEIRYYMYNSFWGGGDDIEDYTCSWRSWLLYPDILSLLGLPVLIVGVWALVQGTSYFSIATTSTIIVSDPILLVIVSKGMLLGGTAHFLFIIFILRSTE